MLRRILRISSDVFFWIVAGGFLLLFITAIRNYYLTWIGITAGILFFADILLGWLLRVRFGKPAAQLWGRLHAIAGLLIVAIFALRGLLPDKGNWRPYTFDADLARIESQRAVPKDENAAEFYQPILENINPAEDLEFFALPESPAPEFCVAWKDANYPLFAARLDELSDTIEKLIYVCQMEQCRWPVQPDYFKSLPSERYVRIKRCAAILLASANRDLGKADNTAAAVKYCCVLQMAGHCYQQPQELDFYVGFTLESTALKHINRFLLENSPDSEQIEFISSHLLPAKNRWRDDWSKILEIKKLQCKNLYGQLYEINDEGKIRFTWPDSIDGNTGQRSPRRRKPYDLYLALSMPLNPADLASVVDRQFRDWDSMLEQGYCPYPVSLSKEVWPGLSLNFVSKFVVNWYRLMIEDVLMLKDEPIRFYLSYLEQLAIRRGSHIIIALAQYKAQHNSWPASLEDIAPLLPPGTLLDPINNDSFVYRVTDEGFTVYSKGDNGIDEGGEYESNWPEESSPDDRLIWPPKKTRSTEEKDKE